MSKHRLSYICSECQYLALKWMGKCPKCSSWNSFEEQDADVDLINARVTPAGKELKSLKESHCTQASKVSTKIEEFDRVLGGGLALGSLNLFSGRPGVGKSTLLTYLLGNLADFYGKESFLYCSGEESEEQVISRAKRLGLDKENIFVVNETSWQKIYDYIRSLKPKVFVLDSIQTTSSLEIGSPAGSPNQVREVTHELLKLVKEHRITTFVIGHITKDGSIAGPKLLEHMVDTVLSFEGYEGKSVRILRCLKNRFGPTSELGILEINNQGFSSVDNPAKYFVEDKTNQNYGSSLTGHFEGSRLFVLEVQSLVCENKLNGAKRNSQGYELNRLMMMLAIIEKYFNLSFSLHDVYLNLVGGLKIKGREGDLSIIASLLSSYWAKPIRNGSLFIGEVGLTGEVHSRSLTKEKLKEIHRLGYKNIITSSRAVRDLDESPLSIRGIDNIMGLKNYIL